MAEDCPLVSEDLPEQPVMARVSVKVTAKVINFLFLIMNLLKMLFFYFSVLVFFSPKPYL